MDITNKAILIRLHDALFEKLMSIAYIRLPIGSHLQGVLPFHERWQLLGRYPSSRLKSEHLFQQGRLPALFKSTAHEN
ncbi:hypothetical protein DPMN_166150 [Dreissena polymorpha]|uniref:Uncharacterized protein n=1 Tax=Dreissena polymorpha TaxID=45954 RepID=A0A9D4EXH2_DREPO|nr:hypothetical protein DPMN_166150 [Dreissena polymorpha]